MTDRTPRLVMLEDITEPVPDRGEPIRTLRDRRGNRYVLLSVAAYVRLLSAKGDRDGAA